jgi:hypothetical protein
VGSHRRLQDRGTSSPPAAGRPLAKGPPRDLWMTQPKLVLADEPTANLDRETASIAVDMWRPSKPGRFHEIVEVRSWIDGPTFVNGIALGLMTPELILVTATFVGYMLYGILGALSAMVSIFLPSFL